MFKDYASVWELEIAAPAKLVLLCIGDHANQHGKAWPSIDRITKMTGLARSTVFEALKYLEERELVSRVRTGKANLYAIHLKSEKQTSDVQLPDISSPAPGHKPIREPIKEPTKKGARQKKQALPEDWQPSDALLEYAGERVPHVDIATEQEKFINHFCYVNPVKRTERGWDASFRNWLLRSASQYRRPQTRMDGQRQRNSEIIRKALARRATEDSDRPSEGPRLRLIEGGSRNT